MDIRVVKLLTELAQEYGLTEAGFSEKEGMVFSQRLLQRERNTKLIVLQGINRCISRELSENPAMTLEDSWPLIDATFSACLRNTEEGSIEEEAIVKEVDRVTCMVSHLLDMRCSLYGSALVQ